jgi:hypothetical protein
VSAQPAARGIVANALTSVADWLVQPADQVVAVREHAPDASPRLVVAVAGLRRRAGATTVARAIGAALAAGDRAGACVVTSPGGGAAVPLGLPAAGRLTRRLAPLVTGRTRACGRLCLVDGTDQATLCTVALGFAPVVIDVATPAEAASAASLADHVVLVADPGTEPSLAAVIAESLAVVGPSPVIVVNRHGRASERWKGEDHLGLPESRLAAQLAAAGREPRGPMGDVVADLVARWGRHEAA